jgi:hypothetical protein
MIHKHNPSAMGFSLGYLGDAMSPYSDEQFAADVAGLEIREETEVAIDDIDALELSMVGTVSQLGSIGFHNEVADLIKADERKLHGLLVSEGIASFKAAQTSRKGSRKGKNNRKPRR